MEFNETMIEKLSQFIQSPPWGLVLVGPPGSGKSTFVKELLGAGVACIVASTDDIIQAMADSKGFTYTQMFNEMDQREVHEQMKNLVHASVVKKQNIIFDLTNMSKKSRASRTRLLTTNYQWGCIDFSSIPNAILQKRLTVRSQNTGKMIPEKVINQMLNAYQSPESTEGFSFIMVVN